jgi:hypothetical protein
MTPYFFDIVTADGARLDFHGHALARPTDALQVAEAMALDIETSDREWEHTNIVVRDSGGGCLYMVNVRHPNLINW